MVRNQDNNDITYPNKTDKTQLLGGIFSFLVLLFMCVLITCLSRWRRRRNDREAEQNRVNARENTESRFKRRKERAESLILTLVSLINLPLEIKLKHQITNKFL